MQMVAMLGMAGMLAGMLAGILAGLMILWNIWGILQLWSPLLESLQEKSFFLEKRIENMESSFKDVCRHILQYFFDFEVSLGSVQVPQP